MWKPCTNIGTTPMRVDSSSGFTHEMHFHGSARAGPQSDTWIDCKSVCGLQFVLLLSTCKDCQVAGLCMCLSSAPHVSLWSKAFCRLSVELQFHLN